MARRVTMRAVLLAVTIALLCVSFAVASSHRHHHAAAARHSVSASRHILHTRTAFPSAWQMRAPASPRHEISFTLALKQRNLDILDQWFNEASDPKHKNYQEFKSIDEISTLVAPKHEEVEPVMQWLHAHGVGLANIKSYGDSLRVTTTVHRASKLFAARFHEFEHRESGKVIVRSFGEYSIPTHLTNIIELVTGLSNFPISHFRIDSQKARVGMDATTGLVPDTWYTQYSVSQIRSSVSSTQGVIEFDGEYFSPSDLALYSSGVDVPITPLAADHIIGPNNVTDPDTEPQMDIELIAAINTEATNYFWVQGNGSSTDWIYEWATQFFATEDVPYVSSISYGWWEGDQCDSGIDQNGCTQLGVDTVGYVRRSNTEIQKIGLRGLSILVASGDSGANGRTNGYCEVPQLRPAYPGSSPYVTAVGATELVNVVPLADAPPICTDAGAQCIASGFEQAVSYNVSSFASGGGFSNISSRPHWQDAAVKAYFASGVQLPPASYYNQTGRGHPDVAAVGHNNIITLNGQSSNEGSGTSASTPIFAGLMAMLNGISLKTTGKPLGFLNPFLYQMAAEAPDTFHDITVGDNTCTEDGCMGCEGFYAAKGWDPVTGLGSPHFDNIVTYFKSMINARKLKFGHHNKATVSRA